MTKTLVIGGESGTITMPDGKKGAYLRAYDKKTGKDAGAVAMPAGQTGSPMTYMLNGKQYIVVAVGAAGYPGRVSARTGCRTEFVSSHHHRRRPQRPGHRRLSCARRRARRWCSNRANWSAAAPSPKKSGPAIASPPPLILRA